ncbi:hypothetical protein [Pectobacterium carotovorum]|uniref:hypothetical protein n=1 Tax=Pectobacterium carotovorum TaxID=554 RepID=UPI00301845F8
MKPEMSTAVMIERLRVLASESQDGVLLSSAVSRIELLLAAESGMSREMACIRHALDIPPDQSVQSGVVDAFVRLNAEILELRNQLAELQGQEPADFRWRHRADDHSGASAWIYLPCDRADDFIKRIADKDNTVEYGYVFSRPVPPAASQHVPGEPDYWVYDTKFGLDISREKPKHEENVEPYFPVFKAAPVASQPYTVPDERAAYEAFIAKRLGDSINTQRAKNGDPEKPDYMAWDMTVGWIAWQGRAAMPQPSSNSPVSSALVAENLALKEIIDRITDLDNEPQYHESGMGCGLEDRNITDRYEAMQHGWDSAMERVYSEVIPCAEELSFPATEQAARELMAKGVDQAASGFHEKAFIAFDGSNEPGLYIRAQLQLLAQQLRDGDA